MAELSSITIDVDSLRFYREIHGLDASALDDDPIYTIALPRFFELLETHKVPATLFVVGVEAQRHGRAFAPVADSGSEIASHSHTHDYRLTQKTPEAIAEDLRSADAALVPLNGGRPIAGFRAPGYNINGSVLEAIAALGYRYDSSLLPAPLYFSARALAIGAYRVLSRPSRSLVGDVRQFVGPLEPYRCSAHAWSPDPAGSILELPMWVEPTTRFPVIGTTWPMLPERVRQGVLSRSLSRLGTLNFEMHGIDLLDESDHPDLAALAPHQKDLSRPAKDKIRAFGALFSELARSTQVLTLADVAARFGAS
jgi:hypothetical protein